jgi:hypothetical protein
LLGAKRTMSNRHVSIAQESRLDAVDTRYESSSTMHYAGMTAASYLSVVVTTLLYSSRRRRSWELRTAQDIVANQIINGLKLTPSPSEVARLKKDDAITHQAHEGQQPSERSDVDRTPITGAPALLVATQFWILEELMNHGQEKICSQILIHCYSGQKLDDLTTAR